MKDKVVRVRMSENLVEQVDKKAESDNRNRSNLIRLAIKKYLKGGGDMKVAEVQKKVQNIVSFIYHEYAERYYEQHINIQPELLVENISEKGFRFYKKTDYFDEGVDNSYEIEGSYKDDNQGIILYFSFYKNEKLHEYQAVFKLDHKEIKCKPSARHSDPEAELKELTYTEK